jgi:ribosome assembly protein RRB1
MDETAYKMHHALTPEWPSLSLDIIPDRTLGDNRTRFPHVVTMIVGSQAVNKNKLTVLRMSDLSRMAGREKTEKELDDEMLGEEWRHEDSELEEEESSSSEEEEELDPLLEHYSFPHEGGINRIRVCPQNSDIVAAWGEAGTVSLYDVGGAIDLLDRSLLGSNAKKEKAGATNFQVRKMRKDPFFVYSGHSTEGFAIDWSNVVPGRLATADCHGSIHIWNATHPVTAKDISSKMSPWGNSSFEVKPTYSPSGDNIDNPSVEDLQWSPNEGTVFASAECGGYVRIYDIRCPNKAMISNKIHKSGADVNVISWNRLVSNLLASGGDDGSFCVWDLRNFQTQGQSQTPKPLARFHCHRTPITSLEWHPTDESMIAVSDDNGTYVYDLSIEEDDPHQANSHGEEEADGGGVEGVIPPQLLFVHSGSEMTKEVHWHPQIPSCVATTSLSGFSVFIPSNL